jgi:hypothetical protein
MRINKRLSWQINNLTRELKFVSPNLASLRIVIFIDVSFINRNQSVFTSLLTVTQNYSFYISQIDFVICLIDANNRINILHWFFIKCKRMTRNVLVSKLFAMIHEFDVETIFRFIIEFILNLSLFMMICINFKFLFDCMTKLDIMQKKRLMINLMCLRQVYERRQIIEIVWINDDINSTDAMIKFNSCRALEDLIITNRIDLKTANWMKRDNAVQ